MTHPGADVDPAEAMLAELAGLDLSLARHVHACAVATEDPSEVADLARAYQRIARSLRQSLALHARLKRDREQHANRAPAANPPCDPARTAERKAALRTAVRRLAWAEYEHEPDEALDAFDLIEQRLERLGRDNVFGLIASGEAWETQPLDDHVADICRALGLPHAAWRDLPDPPPRNEPVPARALESSA